MGDSAEIATSNDLGHVLLSRARAAIARELGYPVQSAAVSPELSVPGATFVTLMSKGHLRGCIGSLQATRPLRDDVDTNAISAAFRDPRFPPLSRDEFEDVQIEVSLLAEPQFMSFRDEADALAQLRPGIDGVIFSIGHNQATFLPQVWESLPAPRDFMRQLKRKAGVHESFWSPDVMLARYQVRKFKESRHG